MTINKVVIFAFILQINSIVAGWWLATNNPYKIIPCIGSAVFAYLIYMEQQD